MSDKKVSVIMASYLGDYPNASTNREQKFIRAVNTFLKQTYENKELIIVADGCVKTYEIYNSQFSKLNNVRCFLTQKTPTFSGEVRSIGLKEATGEIISYLDSISGDRCVAVKINDMIDVISIEDLFVKYLNNIIFERGKQFINLENYNNIKTLTIDKIIKNDYKYDTIIRYFKNEYSDLQLTVLKYLEDKKNIKDISNILNKSIGSIYVAISSIKKKEKKEMYYITSKWSNIKKIIRHKTEKDLYLITKNNGQTEVTSDHSLININNNIIEKVKYDFYETKQNKFNIINNIIENDILKEIDLLKYIDIKNYNFDEKHIYFKKVVNKRLNENLNDKYYSSFKRIIKGDDLISFCRILGFFIAEGSTCNSKNNCKTWDVSNKDISILEILKNDIEKLTNNINFKIIIDNDKVSRLISYSSLLLYLFEDLCGKYCNNKKIPQFIFNINNKLQKIFIDYMIKGDGHYYKTYFGYTSTSLKLISGMSILLKILNIDYTLSYNKIKKSWNIFSRSNDALIRIGRVNSTTHKKINDYVYDIEVENDHIFVDACGCVLLHNTDDVIAKDHLEIIMKQFTYEFDLVYYDDYLVLSKDFKSLQKRIVEPRWGSIGTSSITHINFPKEKNIKWNSGYGHDFIFLQQMVAKGSKFKKLTETPKYYVCHWGNMSIPGQFGDF